MPYIPFNPSYVFPNFPNFDPSQYYGWSYESVGNFQNQYNENSPDLKPEEINENQSKSEEKKRSQIEERSTNEKEKDDVENEEDSPKTLTENKYFNF